MDSARPARLLAGRYRLSEVIGHGGMGVVWRARDELLSRDVAVKEIVRPANLTEHERQTAYHRATREAQLAARLNHPNVVRIYDILEEHDHPWIVMEFLPYRSLRNIVRDEGPLTPPQAAKVGLGILAALRAAHAEGVEHRDVKPANVLIGPDDRVVLTDFGIARPADTTTLTTAGILLGSPSYIAPERARGGPSKPAPAEPASAEPVSAEPDAPGPQDSGPPAPSGSRRSRRPRAAVLGAAALAVIAAGATALALVLTSSPQRQTASPPAGPRSSSPASQHPGSGTPSSGSASASPSSPASASPGTGSGAIPAGFYRFTNSTGFSIGVPDGWQISRVGHYVYITDPNNGGIFLLIDQSDDPKPDPLADWEQQQANRESSYPDYHLIRLESVNYPQAEKAADWEFTYDKNGVPVHVLNRNVLANAHHAYALYWSTPESDWNAYFRYFQAFAATFRPAPA
jgi:eukaryotic-like serine/threonine-protein kinase